MHSVWINVIPQDGVPRRYAGYSGESLLEVMERYDTPGIFGECMGGDPEHTFRAH